MSVKLKVDGKIILIVSLILLVSPIASTQVTAEIIAGEIYENIDPVLYRNVTVYAPAVASTSEGYVGVISTITVTIQNKGSGRVFVDTLPLTQVDMQGSARLAVKVASALVQNDNNSNVDPSSYDYFFVVRTDAPIIGGPSAGAIMTVATVGLLMNRSLDTQTVMTGMINPDGSIGPVGGIPQKIDAAWSVGAKRFLIPNGQGTYTEMETTTETTSGGWVKTVTKPVVKTVEDYVIEQGYEIEVLELADIYEALENYTGFEYTFEGENGEITTEKYLESMHPLASRLLTNASEMYSLAQSKFNESNIPNYFPDYTKEDVSVELENAKDSFEDSEKWYDDDLYYTSTSKSFQSLIHSRFVIYACEYFDSGEDSYDYLESLLSNAETKYENASDLAGNADINGFISLQSVGAAQRRTSEAKIYLDVVKEEINSLGSPSAVLSFLDKIAFIVERSNSVYWWIDIGTKFNDIGDFSNETIENLALEYIEEAQQSFTYSEVLVEEMGSSYSDSLSYLNNAEVLIESARDDQDQGFHASALFQALEAGVKANLAIELYGISPEDKIDYSKNTASNNIAKNRKQGIEPILAVSYYEFAESLNEEESYDSALVYYKYSGMIAGALSFTNVSIGSSSSKYIGVPEYNPPQSSVNIFEYLSTISFIVFMLISLIAGLGIGLIIAGLFPKENKKQNKNHMYNRQFSGRNYNYPDDQTPKSIRDYYRENK